MSRLTEMYDDKSGYFMKNECPMEHSYAYYDFDEASKCIEKLGQLEDIEERLSKYKEFGLDNLISLFNKLTDEDIEYIILSLFKESKVIYNINAKGITK